MEVILTGLIYYDKVVLKYSIHLRKPTKRMLRKSAIY